MLEQIQADVPEGQTVEEISGGGPDKLYVARDVNGNFANFYRSSSTSPDGKPYTKVGFSSLTRQEVVMLESKGDASNLDVTIAQNGSVDATYTPTNGGQAIDMHYNAGEKTGTQTDGTGESTTVEQTERSQVTASTGAGPGMALNASEEMGAANQFVAAKNGDGNKYRAIDLKTDTDGDGKHDALVEKTQADGTVRYMRVIPDGQGGLKVNEAGGAKPNELAEGEKEALMNAGPDEAGRFVKANTPPDRLTSNGIPADATFQVINTAATPGNPVEAANEKIVVVRNKQGDVIGLYSLEEGTNAGYGAKLGSNLGSQQSFMMRPDSTGLSFETYEIISNLDYNDNIATARSRDVDGRDHWYVTINGENTQDNYHGWIDSEGNVQYETGMRTRGENGEWIPLLGDPVAKCAGNPRT
ncbi:MAG: hypothetical protein HC848_06285 [Limnobacter sp.]|nr:hypothetical protein [Limnobacter sp.]